MAVVATLEATWSIGLVGINTLAGDETGSSAVGSSTSRRFAPGSALPDVDADGIMEGIATFSTENLDISCGHPTDPFGTGGETRAAQTYNPEGKKLKGFQAENMSATDRVTFTIAPTNGLAINGVAAGGNVMSLGPRECGAIQCSMDVNLTAGSNDLLRGVASAGTPECKIRFIWGP